MKRKWITIPVLLLSLAVSHVDNSWQMPGCSFEEHKHTVTSRMVQIESEGDVTAVGDNGSAVGVLQIRPIMVHEINRLLKEERYTLEDRWDSIRSVEMFHTFQELTNPDWDEELAVRRWNGGIRGERNPKTDNHWNKYQNL